MADKSLKRPAKVAVESDPPAKQPKKPEDGDGGKLGDEPDKVEVISVSPPRRCRTFLHFIYVAFRGPYCDDCVTHFHCICACQDPTSRISFGVERDPSYRSYEWLRCACTQCG